MTDGWRLVQVFAKFMPYYIYRITSGPAALVKQLELLDTFDAFAEAKRRARELRADMAENDAASVKVMFAETALQAEEQLLEKREAPILREWEK